VTAHYPDNSTRDVSAAAAGTNYTTSNAGIASISAGGLVTAVASGTVVIQATNDGASGIITANVTVAGKDSDGDGIPDEDEIKLGLDPHNPVDAQEDFDRDDLTNLREYQLGTDIRKRDTDGDDLSDGEEVTRLHTNPLLADTDGDGIPDGVEMQTGSDPLNPNSFDLSKALRSIEVTPGHFALVVNTIIGEASQQLTVTGRLIDGRTTINLTSKSRGTNYSSSDLSVANFGATDGRVFAGTDGSATVNVTNSGFTAAVQVTVSSFAPTALSFISIPGFANNVDVSGDFAYVAAGSAGLQVVDVTDRRAPHIVGSLDTPGNANDVRVVGKRAYVADGSAGLRVIDITNPSAPTLLGALDTAGDATDVFVVGDRAYVADGVAGLQIVDVSNPQSPALLGAFNTPGTAKGVEVVGNVAVVADGTSLRTIDVSSPANPAALGSLSTTDARDVTVEGNTAYVADYTGSLRVVDISTPAAPQLRGSTQQSLGGILLDVAKSREFVFGADQFFVNGVPITNVANPASPVVRARLDFPARDDNGTGIAVDNSYVYLTADRSLTEHGTTGDSRLYIGQYLFIEDKAGIPPTVAVTSPAANATFVEGATLNINVQATDDVQVASVDFKVNGAVVFTDSAAPYQFSMTVPAGVNGLTLGATAIDFGNNVGTAADVHVNVIPDPLTTVNGRVVDENTQPVSGASVGVLGHTAQTSADGTFSITGVPTVNGNLVVEAGFTRPDSTVLTGKSAPTAPVAGGSTNVGDIVVRPAGTIALVSINGTNRVAVIDLKTNTLKTTLPVGASPVGASVTPDGRTGIVCNFGGGTLSFVDLSVDPPVVVGTLPAPAELPFPESIAVTPDGRFGVVADGGGERDVISVDLQQRQVVSKVSGLPANQAVAITPDGTLALVVSADTNQVSVLTINANGVLADTNQRVTLSGLVNGPRSIAVTPNGHRAIVTDSAKSLVTVLAINGTVVTNVGSVGSLGTSQTFNTSGIAITPDGRKVYISNGRDSTIAVLAIDAGDNVTDTGKRINVPSGTPETFFGVPGIAVTQDGARLLISGYDTGRVSFLDTATDTLLPLTITVGAHPTGIGMPGRR
jgi:hypothetical protein